MQTITEEKLDHNNHALLRRWLIDIWTLGDHDEMSWKHLGHSMAALLSKGDWKAGEDYNLPDINLNHYQLVKLDALWACVNKVIKLAGKQKVLNTLPDLAREGWFLYINTYLEDDFMPYKELLEKDGYQIRKEN